MGDIRSEKIPSPEVIVSCYDTYGPRAVYPVHTAARFAQLDAGAPYEPIHVQERTVMEAAVETLRRQIEFQRADEALAEQLLRDIAWAFEREERPGGARLLLQDRMGRVARMIHERRLMRAERNHD